ncbi:hypothetical protein LINGRAPRIM_LOCUS352, partial [Linum grandiflorum]
AFCKISEDSIIRRDQKIDQLWSRVEQAYKVIAPTTIRPVSSMVFRYGIINKTCNAWKGVLVKAHRLKTSGKTDDDVIMTAK